MKTQDSIVTEQTQEIEYLQKACRESLLSYITAADPEYTPSKIHKVIIRILEHVESRSLKRVIISMPPRHGKTRLVAQEFTSWVLGRNPNAEILYGTYGAELSEETSRFVRSRIEDNEVHKSVFPETKIDPTSRKISKWKTLKKENSSSSGQFLATGVGGSATGMGADYLIIDDPIKNRKEAESKASREEVWDWYNSTALTRLSPNGVVVIIMTRWHDDDLVGRLTSDEHKAKLEAEGLSGEGFRLFNFEAIASKDEDSLLRRKEGEALWPERWDVSYLKGRKAEMTAYDWSSLYEGRPRPKGGLLIKTEWFNLIEEQDLPGGLRWLRPWDTAHTTKDESDFTASIRCALRRHEKNYELYLRDGLETKVTWAKFKSKAKSIAEFESGPVGIEVCGPAVSLGEDFKLHMAGTAMVKIYQPREDKEARAESWISLAEIGRVYIVRGNWMYRFFEQAEVFPGGSNDDYIDCVSTGFHLLKKGFAPVLV